MPGHGKTVLVSYRRQPGKLREGIANGTILTLTHVGLALVLVLAGFAVISRAFAQGGRTPQFETASDVMVALIDAFPLWRSTRDDHHVHERDGRTLAFVTGMIPCFLWIFVGAPFIERLRNVAALNAALSAVTAAVVGVILNLALWFAIHTIFGATVPVRTWPLAFDAPVLSSLDPWALGLTLASAVAIFRFNWGMIPTLASSCAAGVVLHLLGAI